jgi:glycosyltransferase involved in cell wall biosynthesis
MHPVDGVRVLALITDAWGVHGGISQFNRDFLQALAGSDRVSRLTVVARSAGRSGMDAVPDNVSFLAPQRSGKIGFALVALFMALFKRPQVVLIGHINFCYLGVWLARLAGAKSVLVVYGAEAWRARSSMRVNRSIAKVGQIVGVSRLTLERLSSWAPVDVGRAFVLPCCVDLQRFTPGPKPQRLLDVYRLAGRTVIMTMGRLATQERMKGFDEVIAQLPRLLQVHPDLCYLICGTGSDEQRLRQKAQDLGVSGHVVFAGFVPEAEKPDYYRLADAYVMPSRGEGFGIVVLEALACGLPVLGSAIDGTAEVLEEGRLGIIVDPGNPDAVRQGILDVLERALNRRAPDLAAFSEPAFVTRVEQLMDQVLNGKPT